MECTPHEKNNPQEVGQDKDLQRFIVKLEAKEAKLRVAQKSHDD